MARIAIPLSNPPPAAALPGLAAPSLIATASGLSVNLALGYAGIPGLATYSIQVSVAGGPFLPLVTQAGSTYVHSGLTAGLTYSYRANVQTTEIPLRTSAWSSIQSAVPISGTSYKFHPGDYAMTIKYQQGSPIAQINSDIAALVSKPIPGAQQGYVVGFNWAQLESGSTNNNSVTEAQNGTGQYAGFSNIGAAFNALQSSIPGARMGIYVLGNSYGNNFTAATIKSYNFGNGYYIPAYIPNCGGTLKAYASLGSSNFTNYPVASIYSGSAYYGIGFNGWTGTVLSETVPAFWNPGINQCWLNFWQALSLYKLPSGSAYAGQTLDQCPLIEFVASNDEWSYAMLASFNPTDSGGVTVNPPRSISSTDQATKANAFAAYKLWLKQTCGFFPHTLIGTNFSYGFGAGYGASDTPSDVAGYVNDHISGNGMSAIQGAFISGADTYGSDWRSDGLAPWYADNAKQGFVGIATPVQGVSGPGAVTSTSLTDQMPKVAQIQPTDYTARLPNGVSPRSQAAVGALAQSANNAYLHSTHRIWCMGDGSTFGNTAWTTYVQPALVAGVAAFSTTRPSNLP